MPANWLFKKVKESFDLAAEGAAKALAKEFGISEQAVAGEPSTQLNRDHDQVTQSS